ncbi:MAG: hypothetical protein PGN16_05395, partial [Sphingomonas phyllosphaerae]|uniref:hypothetical protein n=1 Tax=Sphingomonas phyllosphaerae TaxID=257003 RepID=UPI002FFC1C23
MNNHDLRIFGEMAAVSVFNAYPAEQLRQLLLRLDRRLPEPAGSSITYANVHSFVRSEPGRGQLQIQQLCFRHHGCVAHQRYAERNLWHALTTCIRSMTIPAFSPAYAARYANGAYVRGGVGAGRPRTSPTSRASISSS